MSLKKINDIISIQIKYTNKNKTEGVVKTTDRFLKKTFKNVKKKVLLIGKYRGFHFYFNYNTVPFEVMIRDLRSNISITHKIKHSITQKMNQRLKIM